MKLSSLVFVTLFSANAFAAVSSEQKFINQVYSVIETNKSGNEELDMATLSKAQVARLLKAANEESDIWGDTILEGDYVLANNSQVELYSVEKVVSTKSELVAYRIVYGQAAFNIGACEMEVDWDLMSDNPEAFDQFAKENCQAGTISAGAYVSPDFQFHFRDEDAIEDFSD